MREIDPLVLTLGLGALSVAITRFFTGLTFTTTAFYWTGWICAITSAKIISAWDMMPELTPNSNELLFRLHVGAFIGFLLAAVTSWNSKYKIRTPSLSGSAMRYRISPTMEYFVFAVGTCVSIGQVFYRIRGGTVDLSDVAELRADFLDSQYNTGQRILVHITQLYAAVPALFALDDAQEKRVRVKRLAVFLAVTSVGGFTSGGRGWVIAPVLMYLFPYLCAIDGKESWRKAAYAIWQFRYILVLMVGLFSAMLFLRGKGSEKVEERVREQNTLPWYQRDLGVQPFLTYFGTPTCAISAYSDYVEPWAPAYGGMSLGWFSSNLTKIGVYKIAYADAYLVDARNYVRDSVDYRISSTHATIVPRLLTDVGRGGIMWAMAGLMLVCELIYVRLRNRGFILHLIASGCVQFGGFWVNQDLMLFSGGIVLPIFWAYIFMKAFRKELRGSMPIASRAIQLATPRSRR